MPVEKRTRRRGGWTRATSPDGKHNPKENSICTSEKYIQNVQYIQKRSPDSQSSTRLLLASQNQMRK